MIITGPMAQKPRQPVCTSLTSSSRPRFFSSLVSTDITSNEPDDTQPVPPQTRTLARYKRSAITSSSLNS